MSAEKRPASHAFGSSQMVVKRQKSDAKLGTNAVAVVNGSTANGALIQTVSHGLLLKESDQNMALNGNQRKGRLMEARLRSRGQVDCRRRSWS